MNKVKTLVMIIVFIVCFALIVVGQRSLDGASLAMELVGLVGMLALLYVYNRNFK